MKSRQIRITYIYISFVLFFSPNLAEGLEQIREAVVVSDCRFRGIECKDFNGGHIECFVKSKQACHGIQPFVEGKQFGGTPFVEGFRKDLCD